MSGPPEERRAYFASRKVLRDEAEYYREFEDRWFAARSQRARKRIVAEYQEGKRQREQQRKRNARIEAYRAQRKRDDDAHQAKLDGIWAAKRAMMRSDKWPALAVAIAQASLTAPMAPSSYALGLWLVARAQSVRAGTVALGDGRHVITLAAFPSAERDFGAESFEELVAILHRAVRKANSHWREALLALPDGTRAPLVASAKLGKADGVWRIEFRLAEAVERILFDRDPESNKRVWRRARYSPEIVAKMKTIASQRFYMEVMSRNWSKRNPRDGGKTVFRRHWIMTPEALKATLCLRPGERATTVERALKRAIEDLPVSPVTRVQWSPKKQGKHIIRYEFQLVPLAADIRAWISHLEPLEASEDFGALFASVRMQIARYWRNVARVHDKDAWFREWCGNPLVTQADRRHFERSLPHLPNFIWWKMSSGHFPDRLPLQRLIEQEDRPRLPDERYCDGLDGAELQMRAEMWTLPLATWGKPLLFVASFMQEDKLNGDKPWELITSIPPQPHMTRRSAPEEEQNEDQDVFRYSDVQQAFADYVPPPDSSSGMDEGFSRNRDTDTRKSDPLD
jgi:hypothetical protein